MRMNAAREGKRAPVQVMEGNFRVMAGTCPWWDGVRRASAATTVVPAKQGP